MADVEKKKPIRRRQGGYRGKNFDPRIAAANAARATATEKKPSVVTSCADEVQGTEQAVERRREGAQRAQKPTLDPQRHTEANKANPTPQRNHPLYEEAIFKPDISLKEIQQVVEIQPSCARLIDMAGMIYARSISDDDRLNRKMTVEMLNYHTTALLWARLLYTKERSSRHVLTETERDYMRYFRDRKVNMLQPFGTFLKSLGNIVDKRGKQIYLFDHLLPVGTRGGKTGYHGDDEIAQNNHNLYEELATLGVCGDMLMAVSAAAENAVPNIPIVPDEREPTENLLDYRQVIGPRRMELRLALNSCGVTQDAFPETIPNTRFNGTLFDMIDNVIKSIKSFKIEEVLIGDIGPEGTEAQTIIGRPGHAQPNDRWTERAVTQIVSTIFLVPRAGFLDKQFVLFLNENRNKMIDFASARDITWRFIPVYTPHWGGLWESTIKAMKGHLRSVIRGSDTLNFDEARTLITHIEAILNSRPLTPESSDPSDLNALTPGHFLIGGPLTALPNTNIIVGTPSRVKQWKLMQRLTLQFWKRWSSDYLNTLHQRTKWRNQKDNLKVNDFVLVEEKDLPPTHWCMGRVESVHPGRARKRRKVVFESSDSFFEDVQTLYEEGNGIKLESFLAVLKEDDMHLYIKKQDLVSAILNGLDKRTDRAAIFPVLRSILVTSVTTTDEDDAEAHLNIETGNILDLTLYDLLQECINKFSVGDLLNIFWAIPNLTLVEIFPLIRSILNNVDKTRKVAFRRRALKFFEKTD